MCTSPQLSTYGIPIGLNCLETIPNPKSNLNYEYKAEQVHCLTRLLKKNVQN
jgi:hypothetical protein